MFKEYFFGVYKFMNTQSVSPMFKGNNYSQLRLILNRFKKTLVNYLIKLEAQRPSRFTVLSWFNSLSLVRV